MANILHVAHGLTASRIAVAQGFVVGRLLQQRQSRHHIGPEVGVTPAAFGENPRVLQMAAADVVGHEREPAAVRLQDIVRQPPAQRAEVARPAAQALRGIGALGDAQLPGRGARQHHHAAHAGARGRLRVPVRLLVADGREQLPGQTLLAGDEFDKRPISAQVPAHAIDESLGIDARDVLVLCEVANAQRF